jgi:low affinity Fe/Cu permease
MQAKLNELLRVLDKAREKFVGIGHPTDQKIELLRSAPERYATDKDGTAPDTVGRLLDRF